MSPHSSGFSAATLVSGLECAHWPLRSDVTMSQSQNGETLSHGRWQRAGTGVLLAAPAQGGWSRERCTSQLSVDRRPEALGSNLCPVSWGPATLPAQKQPRGNTGRGADRLTFGQSRWSAERRSLVGRPLSTWRAQSECRQQLVTRRKTWAHGHAELPPFLSWAPAGDGFPRRAGGAWWPTRSHPFQHLEGPRPQGGPCTSCAQERAAGPGHSVVMTFWVRICPFPCSSGRRSAGGPWPPWPACSLSHSATSAVRTAVAAQPLPRWVPPTPASAPPTPSRRLLKPLLGGPGHASCWAQHRVPSLQAPGGAPPGWEPTPLLPSRTQLLLPPPVTTTCGHPGAFEALARGDCSLPLGAPSARRHAHNTDSRTHRLQWHPSHLASKPKMGSRDAASFPTRNLLASLRQAQHALIGPLRGSPTHASARTSSAHALIHLSISIHPSLAKCHLLFSERTFLITLSRKQLSSCHNPCPLYLSS